jgi:4-hydroxy-tetrahydrodipicolinate reductase
MSAPIKVVIAGINGRMGKASAKLLSEDSAFQIVGAFGPRGSSYAGQDLAQLTGAGTTGILVSNSIEDLPANAKPDVLLDFSVAASAVEHARFALEHGFRPVIGASGVGEGDIKALTELAAKKHLGAMVVPNFSIGAVLMMEFAQQAGSFFEHVEIVEMHHTKKLDAPSGTAMHTAAKLKQSGNKFNRKEVEEHELLANSRGGQTDAGVRVHSLRLPGLISHQEVIFGAPGELLTIRHDSFNTDCFTRGIKMAIQAVVGMDGLTLGLDKILTTATQREKIGGRTH